MFPLAAPLISGGASLLGSIFSSNTSAQNTQEQIQAQEAMQQQSEAFSASEAQQQMNFQSQMSSTAYQRAAADMKNAGLNPAAMFGSAGASSTPSGASASVGTPSVPMPQKTSPLAGLGNAVSQAVNTAVAQKTLDKMTEEIANLKATEGRTIAETATEKEKPLLIANESAKLGNEMPASRVKGLEGKAIEDLSPAVRDTAVKAGYLGGKVSDTIEPITNTARSVLPFLPKSGRTSKEYINPHGDVSSFDELWSQRIGR